MRAWVMAAFGTAMLLAGCASVTRGTNEQVQFDSDPPGAEMRSVIDYPCGGPCPEPTERSGMYLTDDQKQTPPVPGPACLTPCMAQVPRNQDLIVTFSKPGYEPVTAPLKRQLAPGGAAGFAGNALIGGVTGAVIDTATGAATDHVPNPLRVVLKPIQTPEPIRPKNSKRSNISANQ